MVKHKVYKYSKCYKFSMLPGDRNGSPDESFFLKSKYVNNEFLKMRPNLVFIDDKFLAKLSIYFGKGKK